VTGARIVELEGGTNFRDAGGYPTADGRSVRWGHVYRSGALHRLTDDDLHAVAKLGIRVVFDLRREVECERAPSRLPASVDRRHLPIGGESSRTKEQYDLLVAGRLAEVTSDFLVDVYDDLCGIGATTFGSVLTGMAEPDGTPALVHCTAGKDRTGVAIALLLSVLGVDDELILDDYELSTEHFTERQLDRLPGGSDAARVSPEHFRVLFGAPRHALASALTTLRRRHGSIERYLVDEAGVDPAVFDVLRARLLEDAHA
jgi:protein-tyrosine phosphatase